MDEKSIEEAAGLLAQAADKLADAIRPPAFFPPSWHVSVPDTNDRLEFTSGGGVNFSTVAELTWFIRQHLLAGTKAIYIRRNS